ncbi:MAG: hypothetical protein CL810_08330 [Cobetia sp.]|nr:hypothetical protein [Cobetia sp.]MBK09553.1 hypothetical protein [Cobetia sp.]HAR10151.1 hypothetical protein [Cobetia sp.]HBJ27722.1 hypothetical protein [Cobetia sp.]
MYPLSFHSLSLRPRSLPAPLAGIADFPQKAHKDAESVDSASLYLWADDQAPKPANFLTGTETCQLFNLLRSQQAF